MGCSLRLTVFFIITAVFTAFLAIILAGSENSDPDIDLTTPELIAKYGYPSESHTVVTEDGYILTLHRIPYGKKSPPGIKREPVFVMHGLVCSSADWIMMGPDKGLGYLLANAGYDVWIGNSRGNTWSKKHVTLSPSDAKFWDFSWHEMGVYDLPAVIDYILMRTGHERLKYIGMSMGTTMFYVMASERPEYNDKVKFMISMAPAAFIPRCTSPPVKVFDVAGETIEWFSKLMGIYQMYPHSWLTTAIGQWFCSDGALMQAVCSNFYFMTGGYNPKAFNVSTFPLILGHTPAGAAIKNFLHFGQSIRTGEFRQYNYGEKMNLEKYGSRTPPEYDLSKVTVPVSLIYGLGDVITHPQDVAVLKEKLPNVVAYLEVPDKEFQHLDFHWAIHVDTLVYNDVLKLLAKY